MEEKLRFIFEYEQHERTMVELCQRYGIARETGYVWVRRYQALGADEANRVWCADFKGWFRAQNGERIDPLTITDAHSRYLLRCQAVEKMDTLRVQAIFEAAFREHGMPEAIRTDNGAPFASRAVGGISRLSVWWMKLGIVPERIEAGHPEQNGRHERMHRTLKQEVAIRPAADRRQQQRMMDKFREEYNQVRPHEALEMQTPAAVYTPSLRRFPAVLPKVEYSETMLVYTVQHQGDFRWKKHNVFVSEVLWGERIGLLPLDEHCYTVYFAQFPIAHFDSRHAYLTRLPKQRLTTEVNAGERDASPSPAPLPLNLKGEKLSGMCPV
jgi:transposase InsO family protein